MNPAATVAWWIHEFPPDHGGVGSYAAALMPRLHGDGLDVVALCAHGGPSAEMHDDVPIERLPIRQALERHSPTAILRLRREVVDFKRRHRADLYHLHFCEPSVVLHTMTADVEPAPFVLTAHLENLTELADCGPESDVGRLFEAAAIVTGVSGETAARLAEARPDLADKIIAIENGIPIDDDVAPPVPVGNHLLAIGRLTDQKGFDRLLRALHGVADRVPDVTLTIAGDGPDRESLETLSDELGLSARVRFAGFVHADRIRDELHRCRLLVSPSRFEGMPIAVLEAAERGRATVGTDVGGTRAIVVDGETGVTVDGAGLDTDPSPLAAAIVEGLGRADELGNSARQRAVREFDLDLVAATYRMVYRTLVDPPPRISVIITAHNSHHLPAAVASARAQRIPDDVTVEILIVDDGSDRPAIELLDDTTGVRVFRQPNTGATQSRNVGIALTRGDLIAFLDDDDLWPPDRLERQLAAFDADHGLDIVFGRVVEQLDDDAPDDVLWNPDPQSVRSLTTALIRREAWHRIGPLRGTFAQHALDWVGRVVDAGERLEQIDAITLIRRIHASNGSHHEPFTSSTGRIAALKQLLDERRSRE